MTDDLNVEKVNECLVTPISALNERKPVKIDPKNISFKVKQNLSSNGRIWHMNGLRKNSWQENQYIFPNS